MFKLQTPAIVVLSLLIVAVLYSLSQDEGGSTVVAVYETDEFLDGEWNLDSVPPDRWIGIITSPQGWGRFPGESGYGGAQENYDPDFETSLALIAYMGMMPSEGYGITIQRVEYTAAQSDGNDRLTIRIHVSAPGADELVAQVLSHPYETVVISKEAWPKRALEAIENGTVSMYVVDQNGRVWGPGHIL